MAQADYHQLSDEQLTAVLCGGRREREVAFGEVYQRYSSRVMAYCRCMLNNAEQAEDIFQETFLRFFKACQQKERIRSILGFLLGIARNLCLNARRDRKVTVSIDEVELLLHDHDQYEKRELLGLISMALELLELPYREAFVLRKIEGLSMREIAELCGISVEGAKTRVQRARLKVLDILQPYLKDLCN